MSGLVAEDLLFYYSENQQQPTIQNFSVAIPKGRTVCVTGVSGCGKSTIFSLLAGIYPEYGGFLKNGKIYYDGAELQQLSKQARARKVSMMFQNPELQFCMDTVENELIFCLENMQVLRAEMDQRVEEALAFCHIEELKRRTFTTLSGGEKQKVSLACIVAMESEYILLDEPFANIDQASAASIIEKLIRLKAEKGITMILIDHQVGNVMELVDDWLILGANGRIVEYAANGGDCSAQNEWLDRQGITVSSYPYQSYNHRSGQEEGIPLLELCSFSVGHEKYRDILTNVSIPFYEGKITAITGKSGSGKSTLFTALGKMKAYRGEVKFRQKELSKIAPSSYAKEVGLVFQNPQDQFLCNSVYEEMKLSLASIYKNEEVLAQVIRQNLTDLQLWKVRDFSPYMLSQGQQRRLAVGILLAYDCKVLICDEPTYGQDKRNIEAMMKMLCANVREQGLTVILSTHDEKLAATYADYHYECKEGTVIDRTGVIRC